MSAPDKKDWIERVTAVGAAIGLNPVRLRWRLMKWHDRWQASVARGKLRARQVSYEHRLCSACGALEDRSEKVCTQCGKRFPPFVVEALGRTAVFIPAFLTPTSLLITAILFMYYRTAMLDGNFMDPSSAALYGYGATFPPALWAGEWWRLATYIFLHANVMHLLFNLVALKQIGPEVEQIFGRARMLSAFMITGIVAGAGSTLLRDGGIGIGASGSLMGLIGLTAGWGHRDGGLAGRTARDMMLNWALVTIIFGYFVGADNVAHIVGLLAGGAIGLFSRPARKRTASTTFHTLETLAGAVLFVGTLYMSNFPPVSFENESEATVSNLRVVTCGELPQTLPDPAAAAFNVDCKPVTGVLRTSFGLDVVIEGTPEEGYADLVAKVIHPTFTNPQTGEVLTGDQWETPGFVGDTMRVMYTFDYEWEIAPGKWTFQVFDKDGETLLLERSVIVETLPDTNVRTPN